MTHRVLVTDSKIVDLDTSETALSNIEVTIETTAAREPDELISVGDGADAIIADARTKINQYVLSKLTSLQVIGRSGIGVDNIDLTAAREQDVTVVNVPDYCLDEVSTHAFAMLLSCARKLPQLDRSVKQGKWSWDNARPMYRIQNQTVGVVGFGKIGRSLVAKLRGFDVSVLVYDPYISETDLAGFNVTRVGFDKLLTESDLVSIHVPLTDETHKMFDSEAFKSMPEHAVVVNTARGSIIDEDALAEAIETDSIAGAGLDVRENEPPNKPTFSEYKNVFLSPHVGFYSEEARYDLSRDVSEDVARVLQNKSPQNSVGKTSDWL